MYGRIDEMRMTMIAVLTAVALVFGLARVAAQAADGRILDIRDNVIAEGDDLPLSSFVGNTSILTNEERLLVVASSPASGSLTLSMVDFAYLLQRHPSLLDVKLRGPRSITVRRLPNADNLNHAKAAVRSHIESSAPWSEWEIDMVFSADDEMRIIRVGEFDRVEVAPTDNKSLIGTLSMRLVFFDAHNRQTASTMINPVLLKQVEVAVMNTTANRGHILRDSDVRTVPMWIGDQRMDYVIDPGFCVGKELARRMAPGDIIRGPDILSPVSVRRGDILWVQAVSGTLSVRMPAVAMENGRVGDSVRVKNQSSNKVFHVRLTGEREGIYRLDG